MTFVEILYQQIIEITDLNNLILRLRCYLHFDSFLNADFKKPTYFTFIFNPSSGSD